MKKKKQIKRRPSQRVQMERELGRKLLSGKIPVVPPNRLRLPRCPVPTTHVEEFSELCKGYEEGRVSYEDVLAKVGEAIKKPDAPKTEETPP